eukprot:COSAG03_NODE_619_length_6676_cov_2.320663_3_plen_397_part_00
MTMQGDGELKDWLKDTGRDIGKMVGTHLKKAAKDKAISYAQEQLGLGLADELGMAAKSVASKSTAHALDKVGDVKDVASAKSAAKSVGEVAKQEGLSQLKNLAGKYFGGAGTAEQAVRACMFNVTVLRRIVTKFRRDLNSMSVDEFLRIHATIGLATNTIGLKKNKPFNERIGTYMEYLAKGPRQGGYSMKEKRDMVRRLKKKFHSKPVSKMNRENLVRMIYGTAYDLSINWEPYFEGEPQARRIPKSCAKATGPGSVRHTEANVLPSKGPKRAPNSYAKFVREMMASYDFPSGTSQTEKMKIISREWRKDKENILDEQHYQAIDAEDAEEARRKRRAANPGTKNRLKKGHKIAKRGADDDIDLTQEETMRGPPGTLRSKIPTQKVGKQKRRILDD